MPKIPQFISTQQIPSESGLVPVHPGQVRRVSDEWAKAGEDVQRLGLYAANVFGEIERKNQELARKHVFEELESLMIKEESDIADSLKYNKDGTIRTDWQNFDAELEEKSKSAIERLRSYVKPLGIYGGKEGALAIENALTRGWNARYDNLKKVQAVKKHEVLINSLNSTYGPIYNDAVEKYIATPDEQARKEIWEQLRIKTLTVGTPYAMTKFEGFQRDIEQGTIQSLINNSQGRSAEAIKNGQFPNISKKDLALYEKQAIEQDKKVIKEREEVAVTGLYRSLKNKWGNNYEAMISQVSDPSFQETNDLDIKEVTLLENRIKSDWAMSEEIKKQDSIKTSRQLVGLLERQDIAGIRTLATEANLTGKIDPKEAEHWINIALNPPDVKSNPSEYYKVYKLISEGKSPSEVSGAILPNKGLSNEDKKSLIKEVFGEQDKSDAQFIKEAEKDLENDIIPKRGMMEKFLVSQKEFDDFKNAREAFKLEIEKAKKSGKPLRGKEITDMARQISMGFQKPLYQRALEMFGEQQGNVQQMKEASRIKRMADKYKSVDDVKKDLASNKITEQEAIDIVKYRRWGK